MQHRKNNKLNGKINPNNEYNRFFWGIFKPHNCIFYPARPLLSLFLIDVEVLSFFMSLVFFLIENFLLSLYLFDHSMKYLIHKNKKGKKKKKKERSFGNHASQQGSTWLRRNVGLKMCNIEVLASPIPWTKSKTNCYSLKLLCSGQRFQTIQGNKKRIEWLATK